METQFAIEYLGFAPNESQKFLFQKKIAELEKRFGRIASGRISVKVPGGHHRNGGLYEVSIQLRLPGGKEVDVSRTPDADERHADFHFAVNDAFKRAQRQLQKHAQHLEGEVKSHEATPFGTVTKLFDDHGFIEDADGLEIYFHENSVLDRDFSKLTLGTRVSFHEEQGERGPQASTVALLGKRQLK
jgi:cold shock CspA family protein/ribosome-associated translation inhibitor RaiA